MKNRRFLLLSVAWLVLDCVWLDVPRRAPAAEHPSRGQKWALLIGVDDYTEIRKLKFAGADQRALAEQLIALGFAQDQVVVLHDKATESKYRPFRENIEKQLELVLRVAGRDDLVIVGFSGHGMQLEGKNYLCPEDTRVDKLASTMIPVEGVYQRLRHCRAALRLLLVDACRNDALPEGQRSVGTSRGLGEFDGTKEKPPEGILVLSSCGAGQVSMEDKDLGHGVFMHFVLEGLQGKAGNALGSVTLAGLYDYASLQTKKYVMRTFNNYQSPALEGTINGPWEICRSSTNLPEPLVPRDARKITNSLGMKLVLIPPGEFMMGSSAEEIKVWNDWFKQQDLKGANIDSEGPQHRVRITRPFYLGAHHVTVGQFRQFVTDAGYATDAEKGEKKGAFGIDSTTGKFSFKAEYSWRNPGFEQTDEHPVVCVSWNDAVAFCDWLSRKEGKSYRLPTEAEWEYACRAGTTTRYWCGDDQEKLAEVANVADATAKAKFPDWKFTISASDGYVFTSPVGSFRANPFGLYDMHGNALQWCADWYGKDHYDASPADDPSGPSSGASRVLRGGSWGDGPDNDRSASRTGFAPVRPERYLGFRVARTP